MSDSEIFTAAVKLAPERRAAYLDAVCGDNHPLRHEVESLLRAHDGTGSFLDNGGGRAAATVEYPSIVERPGTVIGPYRLMEQIGAGGMGLVFVAEQTQPVRRKVALKIVKPGMDTRDVIARFEAERQALALMDHPNIATVLDAGATASGRPYFVMELVKGVPISDYCDQQRLPAHKRLELFVSVCQAVQHAHGKGIIHRDLKPSNILVAPHDGVPVVKVIDFGIAKAVGQQLTDKTIYTRFTQMLGTPLYMSPEQAEINALDVDVRSDVYSLGVLLYELLTGTTPFTRERFATAAYDEIRRIIREEDPPKPSTRLSQLRSGEPNRPGGNAARLATPILTLATVSAQRQTEPAKLSALVRGEPDWIVMKCLEKDRNRRYETANSLAQDVQRYLRDEPVQAGPPSAGYWLRKFVKRHRGPVLAVFLVLAALLTGTVGATWGLVEALQQKEIAEGLAEKEKAARDQKEKQLFRAEWLLYANQIGRAYLEWELGNARMAHHYLNACRHDFRGWEHHYLYTLLHANQQTIHGDEGSFRRVAFSPEGARIVSGGRDGTLKVWDAAAGKELLSFKGHDHFIGCVAFSANGKKIISAGRVAAGADTPSVVKVWDAATGQELLSIKGLGPCIDYSPAGNQVVSGSDTALQLWDAATGQNLLTVQSSQPIRTLAFSPNGKDIVTGHYDRGFVTMWRATDKGLEPRTVKPGFFGSNVTFSPDGQKIASGGQKGGRETVQVWDAFSGQKHLTLMGHKEPVLCVAFSPDGKTIVSASRDCTLKLWDVVTGQELQTLKGHKELVSSVVFSPDGTKILSGSSDGTMKLWDTTRTQDALTLQEQTGVHGVAISPDGKTVVTGSGDGDLKLWDAATGRFTKSLARLPGFIGRLDYSRDGSRIISASSTEGAVKVWDAATGQLTLTFQPIRGELALKPALSPDGSKVVSNGKDHTANVWDAITGHKLVTLRGHTGPVRCVAFGPDGAKVVTGGENGMVKLWDAVTGESIRTYQGHGEFVKNVAFNPDGKKILSSSATAVRLWDAATDQTLLTLKTGENQVESIAFSPDGARIVTGHGDGTLKFWDASSGQETLALKGHTNGVTSIAVSLDGKTMVSSSYDATVKVWQATLTAP